MGGQGRIFAYDRDPKRLQRLTANAAATGASSIVAQQVTFVVCMNALWTIFVCSHSPYVLSQHMSSDSAWLTAACTCLGLSCDSPDSEAVSWSMNDILLTHTHAMSLL